MITSEWLDQRDIPAKSKFGKILKPINCECDFNYTCRECLKRAHTRNMAESAAHKKDNK